MTLRTELKKQLKEDYSNAPEKYINLKGIELTWNTKENIYIGKDKLDREWIACIQRTKGKKKGVPGPNARVPIFSVTCICGAPNFVPITIDNNETIKCRKCKTKFIPQLNIDPSSAAFEMFHNLDK